jgi:hypothetical protein
MTREQAINFLRYNPVKFGQMLGFTKLTDFHNGWIKKMARGFIISVECTEMNTSCITFGKFKDFRHMSEMLGKFADLSIC